MPFEEWKKKLMREGRWVERRVQSNVQGRLRRGMQQARKSVSSGLDDLVERAVRKVLRGFK